MERFQKLTSSITIFCFILALVGCQSSGEENNSTSTHNISANLTQARKSEGTSGSSSAALPDMIFGTYSAKSFTAGNIDAEDLETILLTGAKAPSARNLQPWHFTIIKNKDTASQIMPNLEDGSVVIVVSGLKEGMAGVDVAFDCGSATAYMYVTAQALGYGAHIYTGPVQSINHSMTDILDIPADYEAISVLLIGHTDPDVDGISSASERNPLSSIINYVE